MTKLETLYASIQGLEKVGLTLTDEMLKKADELEEQLIKSEILPTLSKDIEPRLSKIQRELVLVVEYKPGEPISVALSRKTNIAELLEAKRLEIDPQVEHKERGTHTVKQEKKSSATGLRIYRKDGSIIQERDAATTFITAIIEAGPLRVRQLGLNSCRINIVSTTKDKVYGRQQHEIEHGLYVLTHSNTQEKKKKLDCINDALHMGWTVEIIGK